MSNVYDKAHELQRIFAESEEFIKLKTIHEDIEKDQVAKEMIDSFRNLQLDLQQKQMQGVAISEEEAKEAQEKFEETQNHELLSKLLEAEQRLSLMISDLNKIITEPLEVIYGKIEE